MSDSLQPCGMEHTRLPCPSPTPRACSNSCPSLQWCHPTLSSSVIPFSSCFQSFPGSGSLPVSHFFASGGQSIGVAASASVVPNEYSGLISFRMNWFDLLSVQGTLKSLLQHHSSKASILQCSAFFMVQLSYPYMTPGKKNIALTIWTFVNKVMSLLFNMLSRLSSFSSKEQASINFIAAVTICSDFGAQENKGCHFPLFPHLFAVKWWDWMSWS